MKLEHATYRTLVKNAERWNTEVASNAHAPSQARNSAQ